MILSNDSLVKLSHEQLLNDFLNETKVIKSKNTYITYRENLMLFDLNNISPTSVLTLIDHWKTQGKSPNTIKLRLLALRQYLTYANDRIEVPQMRELMKIIRTFKGVETVKECLTKEEVIRLINAATNDRDRVILTLLSCTGMRVSELVNLNADDIGGTQVHVRDTKNNCERLVDIPEKVQRLLLEYVQGRKITGNLFSSRLGNRMSTDAVQTLVKNIGNKCGIEGVTPHSFRHYFVTAQLTNGTDMKTLMEMSGHKSMEVVARYSHSNNQLKKQAAELMGEMI